MRSIKTIMTTTILHNQERMKHRVDTPTIIVLEGDETGQELLEEALRVMDPSVTRTPVNFKKYDLSLEARRDSKNEVVHEAAEAIKQTG